MKHILVHEASENGVALMRRWFRESLGNQMFDPDVLEHGSTFVLAAEHRGDVLAFLPISQPLMMESLAFRPGHEFGLSDTDQALVMTRLAEHAIEQCFPRGAGEVYFLCQKPETARFAERHHFKLVDIPLYRFNLREWGN